MYDSIRDWALTELREMKHAPVACVVLVAFGMVGGWWAAKQFYGERIEVLHLQIAALERGIAAFATIRQPSVSGPNLVLLAGLVFALLVGAVAIPSALRNKRIVTELRAADANNQARTTAAIQGRDRAVAALATKKEEYARAIINRYANARFDEASGNVKPSVTIRYCSYTGDDKIAAQIRNVLAEQVGWSVAVDGSNNPALERAEQFKVVFDVGQTRVFNELVHAFSDGGILGDGVTVGVSQPDRAEAYKHLIVKILPSFGGMGG